MTVSFPLLPSRHRLRGSGGGAFISGFLVHTHRGPHRTAGQVFVQPDRPEPIPAATGKLLANW